MTYLAVAYAVFWAVTFIFLFSMTARLQRLEGELHALRTTLHRRDQPE